MRKYTILLLLAIAVFACKKNNSIVIKSTVSKPNYFPMEVGNYWIYRNYKVRISEESALDIYDSLVITRDTVIRDHRYFIFESSRYPLEWGIRMILRDSVGYYVQADGKVFFTDKNTGDIYFENTKHIESDTLYYMQYYNQEIDHQISFLIGDYNVLNRVSDYTIFSQDTDFSDTLKYRKTNNYFIDGIGKANDILFFTYSYYHFEKRLVRYHLVQPISN